MNQSITFYRISAFKEFTAKITTKFTAPLPEQFKAMIGQFVFFLRQKHPYIVKLAIFLLMLLLAFLLIFVPPLFSLQNNYWFRFFFSVAILVIGKISHTKLEQQMGLFFSSKPYTYPHLLTAYTQTISEISNLETLLDYITQTLHQTLNTKTVALWLYHPQKHHFVLVNAAGNLAHAYPTALALDLNLEQLQHIHYTNDLPESIFRESLQAMEIKAIAVMSLGDELIGLIGLSDHVWQKQPNKNSVAWLNALAKQSVTAIKNAWLTKEQEITMKQLQLAYRRTVDAQDKERRHLAAELHDDILGRLTTMTLTLHSSQKQLNSHPTEVATWLETVEQETQYIKHRLREITQGLHSSVLTDLGLIAALQAYLDSLTKQPLPNTAPHTVALTAQGFANNRLPSSQLEQDLYNVTRQALDNAIKHAQAKQVFIHLCWREDTISVTVQDTGQGLKDKVEVLMGQQGHLGLLSMTERTRAWGGRMRIESNPKGGTTVHAHLPIETSSPNLAHLQSFTHYLNIQKEFSV